MIYKILVAIFAVVRYKPTQQKKECEISMEVISTNPQLLSAEDALIARFRLIPYLKLHCNRKGIRRRLTNYDNILKEKVVENILKVNITREFAFNILTAKKY